MSMSIGLVRCQREEIVEFEDDATDDEIQEYYEEWVNNHLDGGWWEV